MKILLDSHTLYWFAEDAPQMPATIKSLIENEQTENFVSVISIWELAIKAASGKLILASPVLTLVRILWEDWPQAANSFLRRPRKSTLLMSYAPMVSHCLL